RFAMLLSGSFTPCWASRFKNKDGQNYIVVLIDRPDWTTLTELMDRFRSEAQSAVTSTAGHADFLRKLLKTPPKNVTVENIAERSAGMINVITRDMFNLQMLMDQLQRLEVIRTGRLTETVEKQTRKINVEDFIEDFVEELGE